MREETVDIFKFEELSEEAKENAVQWYRDTAIEACDYTWANENEATLKSFEEVFPIEATDWEYGYHNYVNYKMLTEYEEVDNLTGIRLLKYLVNNYWNDIFKGKYYSTWRENKLISRQSNCQFESECPLTGYCMDYYILSPIINFIQKPNNHTTFEQLLYECLQSWIFACNADYEDSLTYERISDNIIANEYEFTADGSIY